MYCKTTTGRAVSSVVRRMKLEACMAEKTITCPRCSGEFELTESLAAPLLAVERQKIAAEENQRARLVVATDLDQRAKEIEGLREILQQRDVKLAEAQKAQAQ